MAASGYVFDHPVTIVGGGDLDSAVVAYCLKTAPTVIAADGSADWLYERNIIPDLVIGDLDSVRNPEEWKQRSGTCVHHLPDQDTNDLEKCLGLITAPQIIATGFTGKRIDHTLYALQQIAFCDKKILIIDRESIIIRLNQGENEFQLKENMTVSIIPMIKNRCYESTGLKWDLTGQEISPKGLRSLSNMTTGASVSITLDQPGTLLIIPNFTDHGVHSDVLRFLI